MDKKFRKCLELRKKQRFDKQIIFNFIKKLWDSENRMFLTYENFIKKIVNNLGKPDYRQYK